MSFATLCLNVVHGQTATLVPLNNAGWHKAGAQPAFLIVINGINGKLGESTEPSRLSKARGSPMSSRRLVYQQGDHICALYTSPEEQLQAAVEYIPSGLGRNDRCLYVCGDHTPAELRAALQSAGVNVPLEEGRGALSLVTKGEAHLKDGYINAQNMISFLHQAVQDALDSGFTGLSAAG